VFARLLRLLGLVFIVMILALRAEAADWDRGVALYNKGAYRTALAEFEDIVLARPDAAGAWYYIGLCEFKLKHYKRVSLPLSHAIDLLEIQSPESPDIAPAWYTIGMSHFLLDEYAEAVDPLKQYIELTTSAKLPVDASAAAALGRAYFQLERYDEALVTLGAASRQPGGASAENARDAYIVGLIYFKREDDDRAIPVLREAANGAAGDDAATLELLAESLMRKARKTNAPSLWVEAAANAERLKTLRDDLRTAGILGQAYMGARRFDKAVVPFEALAKAEPENGQAWLYYGIALSRSGQMRKAMEALEITIRIDPGSSPALLELAYVYESDKQYQQALRIYEKAYAASNDPAIRKSIERVKALAAQQP
jgi:tetratricopeptide (TPR) repeat protein